MVNPADGDDMALCAIPKSISVTRRSQRFSTLLQQNSEGHAETQPTIPHNKVIKSTHSNRYNNELLVVTMVVGWDGNNRNNGFGG
jgi:ferric iron reductase protein FhuF